MLLRKEFQGELPENKIVNAHSESQTDTYSCDYINKAINKKDIYSTDEVLTDKLYMGKPVYRKVCEYNLTATSGYPTFDTGITNADRVLMQVYFSNDDYRYARAHTSFSGYFDRTNGIYTFILDGSWSAATNNLKAQQGQYTFIFEYTKTTD